MTDTRIKLGPTDLSRSIAGVPDIRLLNRYFELDPTNQIDNNDLLVRPGVNKFLEAGDGPIRQVYSQPGSFNDDLFFVSGDTVYRVDKTDNTATSIGTLTTSTHAVSMTATDVYLFIADGDALYFYTDNDYARGTLTATALSAGDVVVVGAMYYQFATDATTGSPTGLIGAPWLVKLGVNLEDSIINLAAAIKGDGTFGVQYSGVLNANTDVTVDNISATTLVVRAVLPGTAGNSFPTTETSAGASWGATTLADGGGAAFEEIEVPDGLGIVSVGTIIGFVICVVTQAQGHNGRFYWIWPGSVTIDALDFATAERSPDPVWEVKVVGDSFWLPGESTTEIWNPSGNGDAPFIRQQGRLFDKGIWPGTIVQVKDDVMAVGTDGTVYRIDSAPVVVSTAGISQRIREAINAQRANVETAPAVQEIIFDYKNETYSINGVSKTDEEILDWDSVDNITSHPLMVITPAVGLTQPTPGTGQQIGFLDVVRDDCLALNGGDKLLLVMEGGFVEHSSQTMWCGFEITDSNAGTFIESMPTGQPGLSAELESTPYPNTEIDDATLFKIALRIDLTAGTSSLSLNGEPAITGTFSPTTLGYMNLYSFRGSDTINQWIIEKMTFLVDSAQDLTGLSV